MEVELFPGASVFNFYWMEGPLSGDTGSRVTVLHPGQVQHCSFCLKLANTGCPGKGNGKACEALKTHKTTLISYMEMIKIKQGDDDLVPINPIEEKDNQIVELKKALEESKKEISDINAVKERHKARSELQTAKKSTILANNKLEFARKVTEQRMYNCLNQASEDLEEELVTLYSNLVDEEQFKLENDVIAPSEDFLKQVEQKVMERGEIPSEELKLSQVKNKILEKVKTRKLDREKSRDRRDSISSVRSTSSKRSSGDMAGGEQLTPPFLFQSNHKNE